MGDLLKKMNLSDMILLSLNSIIGSGLFLLPGQVAAIVGTWGILVYIIVALIVMAIAWCFIKCASHYSRNGGAYLYAKEAFGNFIGFEIGIMRWVVGMLAWASLTVGFVVALGSLCPIVLQTPFKHFFIIGLILGLGILNFFGLNGVRKLSNIMTLAKLFPLAVFIIVSLFLVRPSYFLSTESLISSSSFGSAALIIFFAFSGFEILPVVAAEMKDPKKNIPIAIMTAIILSSIFYFLVQALCVGVLGSALPKSLSPLADVVEIMYGNIGKLLVSIGMLVSIGGVIVVASFITPRSCSVMAEDRMIFPKLVQQNRFGSPYIAIIISVLLTAVIALSGNFTQLITISVVSRFAHSITTCLALFVFDRKGVFKPFDRPWKKGIPIFALIGMGWLIMHTELYQLYWAFGALIIGIPIYFLQKKFQTQV